MVGEKRALRGASIGGWTSAAEDKLRSEVMEIRAVGGGVDKSSVEGFVKKSFGTLAKSVARYSLPLSGSNSCFRTDCSTGVRG